MRILKLLAAAVLGIVLSGCVSASYPRLYTPPLPPDLASFSRHIGNPPLSATESSPRRVVRIEADDFRRTVFERTAELSQLEQVIIAAYDSQIDYAEGYQISARQMDESQLPIIAAAGVASLVLFQNPASATEILAGIGVGTGVYSATRSVTLPRRMPELYILGHSALSCIRAETSFFAGDAAANTHRLFKNDADGFASFVSGAREVFATARLDVSTASEDQKRNFQAAMTALNEAIVAANQTLATANRQLAAFGRAPSVFGAAVADVHIRVATKARDGRTVEFAQLRQALTESIQAAGTPRGSGTPPSPQFFGAQIGMNLAAITTNDQIIDLVWRTTRALSSQTQILTSATPDYTGSLTRVAACSATVQ